MKFSVHRNVLLGPLTQVAAAINDKTPLEIIKGVFIDLNNKGLRLVGTDTRITLDTTIPKSELDIKTCGRAVMPKSLVEIVKRMPDGLMDISLTGTTARITSGKTKLSIACLDAEEFPLPEVQETETIDLDWELFDKMIGQTIYAASKDESHPVITGIKIGTRDGRLCMVATDRYRLARATEPVEFTLEDVILASSNINQVRTALKSAASVHIQTYKNTVVFQTTSISAYVRVLEGIYPAAADKFKPTGEVIRLDKKVLVECVERAKITAGQDVIRFVLSNRQMIISSHNSTDSTEELIDIEGDYLGATRFSVRGKFLSEVLRLIEHNEICIRVAAKDRDPIILSDGDEEFAFHMLLQVIVEWGDDHRGKTA